MPTTGQSRNDRLVAALELARDLPRALDELAAATRQRALGEVSYLAVDADPPLPTRRPPHCARGARADAAH